MCFRHEKGKADDGDDEYKNDAQGDVAHLKKLKSKKGHEKVYHDNDSNTKPLSDRTYRFTGEFTNTWSGFIHLISLLSGFRKRRPVNLTGRLCLL